ncbi:histidine phosphatase family protein [Sediminivirga luteola]|uniref:Phosphatase n=1 Tax=Sediminivirga luteola TaxID=1774748 RepID=A0A8J2XJU1_9MICO|nr:histidine phosphatase family protein [Sediminivirga luteola]GGA08107.1 phosphatase [Sediminivirga luteola]
MSTATILLVRHGRTAWTDERRLQGRTDIPLNDAGCREALALRPQIQEWMPQRLIVSPACRARATAELLTAGALPSVQDPRLQEAGLGEWEGLTAEEIGGDYRRWRAGVLTPSAGESRLQVHERVAAALRDAAAGEGPVLMVTHGGVIRAALEILVGLRTDQIVPVDAASLTVLEVPAADLARSRLRHYNLTAQAPVP